MAPPRLFIRCSLCMPKLDAKTFSSFAVVFILYSRLRRAQTCVVDILFTSSLHFFSEPVFKLFSLPIYAFNVSGMRNFSDFKFFLLSAVWDLGHKFKILMKLCIFYFLLDFLAILICQYLLHSIKDFHL